MICLAFLVSGVRSKGETELLYEQCETELFRGVGVCFFSL